MPPTEMSRSEPLCCRSAASFRSSSVLPAATHACASTTVRVMPRAAASARMRAVASPRTDAWLRWRGTWLAPCRSARVACAVRPERGLGRRRVAVLGQADGGLQVRHAVDGDRAVLVVQDDRLGQLARPGPQVHAGRVDQRAVDPEPPRRVVIAADQDHPGAGRPEPGERVLIVRDRVHRRDRAVVDVARDEHGVHALGDHRLDQVVEECRLRFSQVGPVERPPEVPVRGVQEPHGRDSSEPLRHSGRFRLQAGAGTPSRTTTGKTRSVFFSYSAAPPEIRA